MRRALLPAATLCPGLIYLGLHLPFLAWAPDDIDATNFMLALHDFDLRANQPHPPGYPVFIALGRAAHAVISVIGPVTGPATPETVDVNALALTSAVFGSLAIVPLIALWTALGGDRSRAWLAALLAVCSPLFWYTSIRPLSDLPGLAVAVASLALLVRTIAARPARHDLWHLLAASILVGV